MFKAKTVQGIMDREGNIKFSEAVKLKPSQRLLVTYSEDSSEFKEGIPVTAFVAKPEDLEWLRNE